jgi:hypothetical protein
MIAQQRSPSYPRVSLDRAVDLVRRVYDSAYENPIDTMTALNLMGFQGKSGPSVSALSSVKQYGLIEGRDQSLRVTSLALKILHPANEAERATALREAAFLPAFYREIGNQFAGRIPSDQVLKSHLVRNHGFTQGGADFFNKILRDNRAYLDSPPPISVGAIDTTGQVAEGITAVGERTRNADSEEGVEGAAEVLRFRISPECTVRIAFYGHVSQSAIDKTIKHLELVKDNYPLS